MCVILNVSTHSLALSLILTNPLTHSLEHNTHANELLDLCCQKITHVTFSTCNFSTIFKGSVSQINYPVFRLFRRNLAFFSFSLVLFLSFCFIFVCECLIFLYILCYDALHARGKILHINIVCLRVLLFTRFFSVLLNCVL